MTTFEEEQVAAMHGGKRRRRRRTKRRKSRKSKKRKSKRRKSRRKSRRRKSSKRVRRRRRRQRGGAVPGSGRLPQGQLTRQNFGQQGPVPYKVGQKGGSMLWRNLGLTWPKDVYNDSMTYLKNIKNTYAGDHQESTSNVLKQPIADARPPSLKPVDYLDHFNKADASTASNLKI